MFYVIEKLIKLLSIVLSVGVLLKYPNDQLIRAHRYALNYILEL